MTWTRAESVICPSWNLPNHCPILLSNSDKHQTITVLQSALPTRHILLYSSELTVVYDLDQMEGIRCIYPYLFSGITIVSFYSLQAAQLALDRLREQYPSFQLDYAKPCLINKKSNERLFVMICQTDQLSVRLTDYRHHLQKIGTLHSLSETIISPSSVLISLEYDDERSATELYQQYHQVILKGCHWMIYFAENNDFTCHCQEQQVIIKKETPIQKASSPYQSYFSRDLFTNPLEPNQIKASISSSTLTSLSSLDSSESSLDSSLEEIKPKQKRTIELDLERVRQGLDRRTTFMIRNIPNKYTQKMLMDSINATHANTYDFLYLRIDFQNKCNVGYAFINFTDPKSVLSFAQQRVGKKWDYFNSDKRCALSYATIQGKAALIRKFKHSQVMSEDVAYRPKLFYSEGPNKGKEQQFPHQRERRHQRA